MVTVPFGRSSKAMPATKIIELRHVREHIVGDDEVRLAALRCQFRGDLLAEKLDQRRHADFFSSRRHRIGRIDPEHRNAHAQEILEQVAIVAGQFNHQARAPQRETLARHVAIRFGVREPIIRVR